jgi:hypothetical protein
MLIKILNRTMISILMLSFINAPVFAQYVPGFIHDMLDENGLEFIYPPENDRFQFFDGDHTKQFPYDFKLRKKNLEILIQVDENNNGNHPHIQFARNLADLAFNSDDSFIRVRSFTEEQRNERNADWMLEADFRPRGFFLKRKGKLVSFYSDNGSIVNLVYLYMNELEEYPILKVKSYTN